MTLDRPSPGRFKPRIEMSRRRLLGGAAAGWVAGATSAMAAPARAPSIHRKRRPRLRVLGTHVTLREPLRVAAEEELGIELEFAPGGSATILQQASTRPESFDIYEQWSNSLPILWEAGSLQAIDKNRIERWSEVNGLCKTGRVAAGAPLGAGDAPYKMLYVDERGSLSSEESDEISFLPYVHNVDSFGYNEAETGPGTPYGTESWGWLLDERFRGKVGVVNEPTIGLFDLALSAVARGLIKIPDIGAISESKLDELFDILIRFKRSGHFGGFWNSVPHSIELMQTSRVSVESMFSPAAVALQSKGKNVVYAAPKEGYRAWHGIMCLSSKATEEAQDAAYKYMNWWLSGPAGAFVARQGYYISNPEQSFAYMSEAEVDFWYRGAPAAETLKGPDSRPCVKPGALRRGGTYENRFSHVAVWNTVMDTYEHSLGRWYALLSS